MAFKAARMSGGMMVIILIIILIASITQEDCACTDEGNCFCMETGEQLHTVTEDELHAMPEPEQSQYRNFLAAWEAEFALRTQTWASLYAEFHATERSDAETIDFDRQLANAYQDFLMLFRARDKSFRERLGIEIE